MGGELAMTTGEVHEAARAVLRFWFQETPAELRFAKNDAFDATIRERFGKLRDRVADTGAAGWDETPDTLLAAIIVLDQFSRNLFRGKADAYEVDSTARGLLGIALRHGWDKAMSSEQRVFLYMPLMHSEDMQDQADSVTLFTDLGIADNLKFAIAHRDVVARFGRFPSRNEALGRASTAAEQDYLSQPGAGW